jgi:hypothetical protein
MTEPTPAWLAERLKKEGEKVVAYFSSLTDAQWDTEVYSEEATWTVRNVLAHFVTSERGLLRLFDRIREGGPGAAEDFSIDHYNARQQKKTRNLMPEELLNQYVEMRANMAEWVSKLSQEDLLIEGRHPFLGQVQLVEMVKMIYLHNQSHFRDIRKLAE